MIMTNRKDSFYRDQLTAKLEHARIIRCGGKAYLRMKMHPKKGKLYRLRVQKPPA